MKVFHRFGKLALVTTVSVAFGFAANAMPSAAVGSQRPPQGAEKKKGADLAPAQKAKGDDETEKEKYEIVTLPTEDGVALDATYFPSKLGKKAPAIILLHGYGEKQRVFDDLAFDLQDRGYAVLTFDFRGHGKSTRWIPGHQAAAATKAAPGKDKLDYHDLRTAQHLSPLLNDIEAAKRFLVRRNNAGELNVAQLAVVGTEMGASLGVLWSYKDWQFTSTVGFTGKQGQDVLTLVLISPQYNFKGLAITDELRFLQQRMPIQVIAGKKDTKSFNEADKIYKSAAKANPKAERQSELMEVNTKLQGSKLLDPELEFEVNKTIIKFLDVALKKRNLTWSAREIGDTESADGK